MTWISFSASPNGSRSWSAAPCSPKERREKSKPIRRCARSIWVRPAVASALELRQVSAGYGETVVIERIDLRLAAGECVSVIGRNGVGKSTLLATIMGHTVLHAGDIILSGANLNRVPPYRRALAGMGFVPQEREIFPSLTVRENLEVASR